MIAYKSSARMDAVRRSYDVIVGLRRSCPGPKVEVGNGSLVHMLSGTNIMRIMDGRLAIVSSPICGTEKLRSSYSSASVHKLELGLPLLPSICFQSHTVGKKLKNGSLSATATPSK